MEVEILARIQFAFTVAFHYIYPPLSIGLGLIMVAMEAMFIRTKNPEYEVLARFWTKIFALTFGIGVATGIVMEFEFGTNWATYSRYVGDVFGSALAAEGIFAFALESGFLGILLFGWNRVKPWVHMVSTVGVFFGSMFSAIWIVVANSWQQTPAGYHIVGEGMNARAEITDFWAMVFNPSSMDRLSHVWIGAFLAGAFLIMSVHAYYILKNRHVEISKKAFKIALAAATIFSLSQLVTGHHSADGVAKNQPAKLAALEGHYPESAPADMYIFGWVDQETKEVTGLKVPGGLSFLLEYDFDHPVTGLDAFPEDEIPGQVNAVFQFYHIMVAIGMSLIGLTLLATFLWIRGKLFDYKWLMKIFVWAVLLPQIANQVGWFAAEMGRQPWVVYGHLKTSDAFSQHVAANQVMFSLIMFFVIYLILFLLFIYLLTKKIKHGPDDGSLTEFRPLQQEMASLFTLKKSEIMATFLGIDYQTWWFLVVGALFSGYAILDGFDFGAGAWHLFFKREESRRVALNAVGPVWDGNEVWLVIGGGALFAGFPILYATLFSSMYIPFMLFLMFIIFRAISIEFRSKEPMAWWRKMWDIAYSVSSIMLAFLLGVVLGNVLQGIAVGPNYEYMGGGFFEFLNPYSIIVGVTTLALFMTHGAIYLLMKTEGRQFLKLNQLLKRGMIFFIVSFGITTMYTLIYIPHLSDRLSENPAFFALPLAAFLSIANVPRLASKKKFRSAFLFSALSMSFMLMLVAAELYPTLMISTIDPKYNLDVYNAAASEKSLEYMLIIAAIGTPLVLGYTAFVYRTFRGKVTIDEMSY